MLDLMMMMMMMLNVTDDCDNGDCGDDDRGDDDCGDDGGLVRAAAAVVQAKREKPRGATQLHQSLTLSSPQSPSNGIPAALVVTQGLRFWLKYSEVQQKGSQSKQQNEREQEDNLAYNGSFLGTDARCPDNHILGG